MKLTIKVRQFLLVSDQANLLLMTLIALVVSDGILTNFLINERLATEANPLLRSWAGQDYFPAIKLAGGFVAALLLWSLYRKHPRLSHIVLISGVVLYTIIVYWNLLAFAVAVL